MTMKIAEIISKIEGIAIEMQRIYKNNRYYFDKKFNAERLGFDNIVGNMCLYDIRCLIERNDFASAMKFNECNLWFFNEVMKGCERLGYGEHAAANGFDVTKPAGKFWTLSEFGKTYCNSLDEILKTKIQR